MRLTSALSALFIAVGLSGQAFAAASLLPPAIPQSADWIIGPATNALGTIGEIKIPRGCKFVDAQGARTILQRQKNPIPKGLVGIMAPEAGAWWVVFEYNVPGYIKADSKDQLNPETILSAMRERLARQNDERTKQGLAPITTLAWELNPAYDASDHTVEWAIRAQSDPEATNKVSVVNHTVRFLGRHGVLDAIAVRQYQGFTDLAPLKQLVKGVSFKEGERYTDYKEGDKLAAVALAESLSLDNGNEPSQVAESAGEPEPARAASSLGLWIGLGAVVSLGALVGVILALRPQHARERAETAAPIYAQGPAAAISTLSTPLTPQPAAAAALHSPAAAPLPTAGVPRPRPTFVSQSAHKNHGAPRRKAFDYNRYFGDLMSAVSSHGPPAPAPVNGSEFEPGLPGGLATNAGSSAATSAFQANAELIANQTTFIEEQRRLIQEQTKLIEEKSKLIAEKNALLKLQSELMENKLL